MTTATILQPAAEAPTAASVAEQARQARASLAEVQAQLRTLGQDLGELERHHDAAVRVREEAEAAAYLDPGSKTEAAVRQRAEAVSRLERRQAELEAAQREARALEAQLSADVERLEAEHPRLDAAERWRAGLETIPGPLVNALAALQRLAEGLYEVDRLRDALAQPGRDPAGDKDRAQSFGDLAQLLAEGLRAGHDACARHVWRLHPKDEARARSQLPPERPDPFQKLIEEGAPAWFREALEAERAHL